MKRLIGKNVAVRGVTMIYTGRLVEVTAADLVLTDAAWIAETGRWTAFVARSDVKEVEPYPDDQRVWIPRGTVCDVTELLGDLPRKQI